MCVHIVGTMDKINSIQARNARLRTDWWSFHGLSNGTYFCLTLNVVQQQISISEKGVRNPQQYVQYCDDIICIFNYGMHIKFLSRGWKLTVSLKFITKKKNYYRQIKLSGCQQKTFEGKKNNKTAACLKPTVNWIYKISIYLRPLNM